MKQRQLCLVPGIEVWRDFITDEEIGRLNLESREFESSKGFNHEKKSSILTDARTSSTSFDPARDCEFIRQRIFETLSSKLDNLELDHIEPMQITRYEQGQKYIPHYDFFNVRGHEGLIENDRRATVIVYLNDGYTGGTTIFPDLDMQIVPRKGMALFFRYDYDAKNNGLTRHGGEPVTTGVKYITQAFIRNSRWPDGTQLKI